MTGLSFGQPLISHCCTEPIKKTQNTAFFTTQRAFFPATGVSWKVLTRQQLLLSLHVLPGERKQLPIKRHWERKRNKVSWRKFSHTSRWLSLESPAHEDGVPRFPHSPTMLLLSSLSSRTPSLKTQEKTEENKVFFLHL